jgi:hypothetical protein
MKMLSIGTRVAVIGVLCIAGGAGAASIVPRNLTNLEGHQSSLKAKLTLSDGSVRSVTLEGVGCPLGMCSRVKAREQANSIWLDGLASIREISKTAGPLTATFKFRNGTERQASIIAVNRVLYVQDHFGHIEKLDLGSLSKIDFE